MRCILCYDSAVNIPNARTKEIKGLIIYYKTCGIIALKKHVDVNHSIIVFFLKKLIVKPWELLKKQLVKKRSNVPTNVVLVFFVVKEPFKNDDL